MDWNRAKSSKGVEGGVFADLHLEGEGDQAVVIRGG